MREVNPDHATAELQMKAIFQFLLDFVKHPTQKITQIPDWNWPSLFFIQISVSIVSGALAGLLKLNVLRVAFGFILMPIISTIFSFLLTIVFYYYFQFAENRVQSFKKLFAMVIVASIPFYLFQVASEYFAPVVLIGFIFTSALLVIALNENFAVPRRRCYEIVGTLLALVLITWTANQISPA